MVPCCRRPVFQLATVPRPQGTVNGIGERTGNANLMTIVPTLQLKMGVQGVGEKLSELTALSRFTDEQVRHIFYFPSFHPGGENIHKL